MSAKEEREAWTKRVTGLEMQRSIQKSGTKYGAIKKTIHGKEFHSTKEANRYVELALRMAAKEINGLELQPSYELWITPLAGGDPIKVGKYLPDFRYIERGRTIVEDVKGVRTPVYKLKKRIVEALYGVTIEEV